MAEITHSNINKITGLSIDDWYSQNPFSEPVKLIKIDIEGSELLAFEGMPNFLKDKNYPPIYLEANSFCIAFNNEMTIPEYLEPFQKLGYEAYFIKDDKHVERFNNDFQLNVIENYLMVHKDNQEILKGKEVTNVPRYTPEDLMKSILKQNLSDSTAFYFAVTFKKIKNLHKTKGFKSFVKYYSQFKEPYSQKMYKELSEIAE